MLHSMVRPGLLWLFLLTSICACQPLTPFDNGPDRRSKAARVQLYSPDYLAISANQLLQGSAELGLSPAPIYYLGPYSRERLLPVEWIARLTDDLALLHLGDTEEWYTLDLVQGQLSTKEAFFRDLEYESLSGFANDDPFFISRAGRLFLQMTGTAYPDLSGGGTATGRFLKMYRAAEWQERYQQVLIDKEVGLCAIDSNGQILLKNTLLKQAQYEWWNPNMDIGNFRYWSGIEGFAKVSTWQNSPETISDYRAIWAYQGGFWGINQTQLYQISLNKPDIEESVIDSLPFPIETEEQLYRFSCEDSVIILNEQGKGFTFHYPSQQIRAIETSLTISTAIQSSKSIYVLDNNQRRLLRVSADFSWQKEVGSSQWAEISAFTVSDDGRVLVAGRLQGHNDYQVLGIAPDGTETIFPGSSSSPITQVIFAHSN
ncbi:MAG: hypothetical protein AAF587_20935 [Bacteroidota bacterium]